MKRHVRDNFFVVGEGILTFGDRGEPACHSPTTIAELRKFRFSRLGPKGPLTDESLRQKLAAAMTRSGAQADSAAPSVPAGFTYLGQFVDHDLTLDKTARSLGERVTVAELVQGRSPALDLDSLYGRGPEHREDAIFYSDGARLKVGTTVAVPGDERTNQPRPGFDLPRVGEGSTLAEQRAARIPDPRNDENLAVAQTHLAFIRFHNRVVDQVEKENTPTRSVFERARRRVTKHYQWMLRHDFLPRIVDEEVLEDVFRCGRRFFERHPQPGCAPTMPIEFSVAAYRLGHSMIRDVYQWNRIFQNGGITPATLLLLFRFSGTAGNLAPSGTLDDPNGGNAALPTNWIADFRRLYDFSEAGRKDLIVSPEKFNLAKGIDTLLVDPLATLPVGTFGGRGGAAPPAEQLNLAFRNLTRGNMVRLASGQQMAAQLDVEPLSRAQIIDGAGGAELSSLTQTEKESLLASTPLWFYVLREAELNGGRMTGVGGRIVAEVFHRAMQASSNSILWDPLWRPTLGPDHRTFRMVDLLLFAFEGKAELLNPMGD
jgi:heme peroxidase